MTETREFSRIGSWSLLGKIVGGEWLLGDPGSISPLFPRRFVGTSGYYPERGELRADVSGDLYALGKTLYCAATGMRPECYPLVPDDYDYDRWTMVRRLYRAAVEGRFETASGMLAAVVSAQARAA